MGDITGDEMNGSPRATLRGVTPPKHWGQARWVTMGNAGNGPGSPQVLLAPHTRGSQPHSAPVAAGSGVASGDREGAAPSRPSPPSPCAGGLSASRMACAEPDGTAGIGPPRAQSAGAD